MAEKELAKTCQQLSGQGGDAECPRYGYDFPLTVLSQCSSVDLPSGTYIQDP